MNRDGALSSLTDAYYRLSHRIYMWRNPSDAIGYSMFSAGYLNREARIISGSITVNFARSIPGHVVMRKTFDYIAGPDGLHVIGAGRLADEASWQVRKAIDASRFAGFQSSIAASGMSSASSRRKVEAARNMLDRALAEQAAEIKR